MEAKEIEYPILKPHNMQLYGKCPQPFNPILNPKNNYNPLHVKFHLSRAKKHIDM